MRNNSNRVFHASGLLFLLLGLAGCQTTEPDYETGRAMMLRKQYVEAYDYFDAMTIQDASDTQALRFRQSAAKMGFRTEMARAETALLAGDLEGFLQHTQTAAQFQPESKAAGIAETARAARARGHTDGAIVLELIQGLQQAGAAFEQQVGLRLAAEALQQAVTSAAVATPLTLIGFKSDADQAALAESLRGGLTAALLQLGVETVDRDLMEKLMQEQSMQMTDLFDEAHSIEIGQLVGAKTFLTGSLLAKGSNVLLQLKSVDVEKATVTWTQDLLLLPIQP